MSDQSRQSAATTETATAEARPDLARQPRRLPPYNVVLLDDDDHSFEYVIEMVGRLFGHSFVKGFQIAEKVHTDGRAVCLTTTKEHAELKRDQIHAFGPDPLIASCAGPMSAIIEPAVGDDDNDDKE